MRTTIHGRALALGMAIAALGCGGCKTFTERYIALEVWKYEKCFGHLPPGFTPPGAALPAAAPPMRPCGQASDCCQSAPVANAGCNDCQGAVVEGGAVPMGAGAPALPAGPGGSPGPLPAGSVTTGRPVVISDEVVLP
ncbi:MAG: hypothetical protein EBZ74_06340 [Planctomycetia bacterium]|nr:hypothetical protein [Planctomycetia bacterium]